MPESEFVSSGKGIRFTAAAAYAAGDVIAWGTGVAIITVDVAIGDIANAYIQGEFEFAKAAGVGEAMALGVPAGYDTTLNLAGDVSGADLYAGRVTVAATDNDTFVRIAINSPAAESLV